MKFFKRLFKRDSQKKRINKEVSRIRHSSDLMMSEKGGFYREVKESDFNELHNIIVEQQYYVDHYRRALIGLFVGFVVGVITIFVS